MKLFSSEKQLKDLVFIYTAYSYINADLMENDYISRENGFVSLKIKEDNENFDWVKKMFDMEKMLFNALITNGLGNSSKAEIISNRATKEINKAFGGTEQDVIAFYLGVNILFKYKEDVNFKKVFINVNKKFLINFINELNDKFYNKDETLSPALDRCELIVDRLYDNLYNKKD